jgi:hypothetical protein
MKCGGVILKTRCFQNVMQTSSIHRPDHNIGEKIFDGFCLVPLRQSSTYTKSHTYNIYSTHCVHIKNLEGGRNQEILDRFIIEFQYVCGIWYKSRMKSTLWQLCNYIHCAMGHIYGFVVPCYITENLRILYLLHLAIVLGVETLPTRQR